MSTLHRHRDLLADGWTHHEIVQQVRSGSLLRIRRGIYRRPRSTPEDWFEARALDHLELVRATVPLLGPAVVSHQSAALLHGLPHLSGDLTQVHVTRSPRSGGRGKGSVHLYTAQLPERHCTWIGETAVTTLARTVVDLLRRLPPMQAVALGDAALRQAALATIALRAPGVGGEPRDLADEIADELTRPGGLADELAGMLVDCRGWAGIGRARRSVAQLDGRSESVGESISRVVLAGQGVPMPQLQHKVRLVDGRLARADFGWPELGTLGEFDGLQKYRGSSEDDRSAADAVISEKRREDALRDVGWEVARWVWADLKQPAALAARLERAFARARRRGQPLVIDAEAG